jgi:hypothetical protein
MTKRNVPTQKELICETYNNHYQKGDYFRTTELIKKTEKLFNISISNRGLRTHFVACLDNRGAAKITSAGGRGTPAQYITKISNINVSEVIEYHNAQRQKWYYERQNKLGIPPQQSKSTPKQSFSSFSPSQIPLPNVTISGEDYAEIQKVFTEQVEKINELQSKLDKTISKRNELFDENEQLKTEIRILKDKQQSPSSTVKAKLDWLKHKY